MQIGNSLIKRAVTISPNFEENLELYRAPVLSSSEMCVNGFGSKIDYNTPAVKSTTIWDTSIHKNNQQQIHQICKLIQSVYTRNNQQQPKPYISKQQIEDIQNLATKPLDLNSTAVIGDLDGSALRFILFLLATDRIQLNETAFAELNEIARFDTQHDINLTDNKTDLKIDFQAIIHQRKLLKNVFNGMTFVKNSPKEIIIMGDVLFDRFTRDASFMFFMLAMIKNQNPQNTHCIQGNHDNAKGLRQTIPYNSIGQSNLNTFFGGIIETDPDTQEFINLEIDQLQVLIEANPAVFENFYYDKQNARIYSHHGFALIDGQVHAGFRIFGVKIQESDTLEALLSELQKPDPNIEKYNRDLYNKALKIKMDDFRINQRNMTLDDINYDKTDYKEMGGATIMKYTLEQAVGFTTMFQVTSYMGHDTPQTDTGRSIQSTDRRVMDVEGTSAVVKQPSEVVGSTSVLLKQPSEAVKQPTITVKRSTSLLKKAELP